MECAVWGERESESEKERDREREDEWKRESLVQRFLPHVAESWVASTRTPIRAIRETVYGPNGNIQAFSHHLHTKDPVFENLISIFHPHRLALFLYHSYIFSFLQHSNWPLSFCPLWSYHLIHNYCFNEQLTIGVIWDPSALLCYSRAYGPRRLKAWAGY